MTLEPSSAGTRILLAVALASVATLGHWALAAIPGVDPGVILHAIAIAATAWLAGFGPAMLAWVLSLAYRVLSSRGSLPGATQDAADIALWLLCGLALATTVAALRRRRALDAFALQAGSDAVITCDAQGRIVGMNPAAEALIDREAANASEQREALGVQLDALDTPSAQPRGQFKWLHPRDGARVFACSAMRRGWGAWSRRIVVLRDVTPDTAHDGHAAMPDRDRLSAILDASDARMLHVDRALRLTWCNRAMRERHAIGDGVGTGLSALLDAQSRAALLRPIHRALDGQGGTLEWRALDPRGQPGWTFTTITPDVDAGGAVLGCFLVSIDADGWQAADRIRQRSEDQRRGVLESLPDLVWIASADGSGDWFNQRWAAYTGRSVTHWTDPMPAEDRERAEEAWQRARNEGQPLALECRLRRHDDVLRWHLVRMQPLRESVTDDAVRGWCGSCTDIDDRKHAEVTMRATQQRIGTFLGTLSHELRNPLAALSAAVQIVRHPRAAPAMAARAMDTLERQCALLARMVEELLDAARLMDGRIDLQRRCVVLNHLLKEVCEDLSPHAARRGVNLHCVIPPRTILVDADQLRIKQAVENLAVNALEACPAGATVTISTLDGEAGEAGIRVADSGCGLSAESLATLFDLGATAHPDKRNGGGLGLGLKTVKRIVQLHGGRLVAASEGEGKGSTFDLFLPLHDARGVVGDEHELRRDGLLHGQRILVIGDIGMHEPLLRAEAERCGAEDLQVARSGFDGLRVSATLQPTVLVCSLNLPTPLSAGDIAREILRGARTRPRLVAVGDDAASDFCEAHAAGFDECLIKPVAMSRLLAALVPAPASPAEIA